MNEKDFAELAAGAALHALSPEDADRYRRALAEHPEWQRLVDSDVETAGVLAEGVPAVPVPDGIRAALLEQIAVSPQEIDPHRAEVDSFAQSTAETPPSDSRRRRVRLLFALAASVALLGGIGVGAVAINGQMHRPASVVALEEIEAARDAEEATILLATGGTVTAHWSASLERAVVVTDGIVALSDKKTYQLWFVRDGKPISAGTFATDNGAATAVLAGDMQDGDVIAMTVERAGGSASGAPTSAPLVIIPTA